MPVSLEHKQRVLKHLEFEQRQAEERAFRFRAFSDAASHLERKAGDLLVEAKRYRDLAERLNPTSA